MAVASASAAATRATAEEEKPLIAMLRPFDAPMALPVSGSSANVSMMAIRPTIMTALTG